MNLFAKLEYCNVIGSLKDRPAFWILQAAIEQGEIDTDSVVVESSSGNFAIALAVFCKMLCLRFVPVIDPNISRGVEAKLRSLCEIVVKVDELDDAGGFLKTRLQKVRELLRSMGSAYWPNQYGNHNALLAHYHLTGEEICKAFSKLDFVFVGVSTAGTIAGVSQRVKEKFPAAKIIAVDAKGSVIFGSEPRARHIPGIGSSVVPIMLREAKIDGVITVPELETVAACHELLEKHHLFLGGSSGTAYAAIKRYFSGTKQVLSPNVLFIAADRGTAYLDTVYNEEWVRRVVDGD